MPAAADTVLILTHSADHYVIERVAGALEQRGARALRFDTDLFPLETRLSAQLDEGGESERLCNGAGELDARRVRAVWARKLRAPRLPDGLEPRIREGCARESTAALRAWLSALEGVRWVNPLGAGAAAENKLRQLRLARALGLCVPRTLVSNDPDAVRAFHAEVGTLVTKMLTPLSVSMGKADLFVRTTEVRGEDLADLDGLRASPMVFQERIEKRRELRVACVGARAFAGAIDASRSQAGQTDWRGARPDEASWEPATLAPGAARALRELLERLGLVYGAADLIETPTGELVFLELNPSGEWGMLERDLGLPIGAALAEELLAS
jgi:glutathione synthase/RimK-type ligase-like ATP-grasp enzyme